MFIDTTFKKFHISENDKIIGSLNINEKIIKDNTFMRPFIRNKETLTVTKIGDRNYEELNKFIINSLNDYYNQLVNSSSVSEKSMMLKTYNHLYEMWRDLYNARRTNNITEMDKIYDLFSYELYVLDYTS